MLMGPADRSLSTPVAALPWSVSTRPMAASTVQDRPQWGLTVVMMSAARW